MWEAKKAFGRLGLLGTLIFCLWLYQTAQTQSTGEQRTVPVVISQVDSGNPSLVELRCESVRIFPPNVMGGISCVIKNNANRNIAATNLTYSVVLGSAERTQKDTKSLTSLTLVHPDFRESYKPIAANAEKVINSPSSSYSETIQSVEIALDYIEFEDGSSQGSNSGAAKTIQEIREGAAIYKIWLGQKYREGEGILNLAALVDRDEPFSEELLKRLGAGKKEDGARAYRSYARRQVKKLGVAELEKYLRK